MKKVIISLCCLVTLLTGCALFPLRADEEATIRTQDIEEESDIVNANAGTLVKPAAVEEGEEAEEQNIKYCVSAVNIRDAASSNSRVVGMLRTGDKVSVISIDGEWVEIVYEGQRGFVYERFLGTTRP